MKEDLFSFLLLALALENARSRLPRELPPASSSEVGFELFWREGKAGRPPPNMLLNLDDEVVLLGADGWDFGTAEVDLDRGREVALEPLRPSSRGRQPGFR